MRGSMGLTLAQSVWQGTGFVGRMSAIAASVRLQLSAQAYLQPGDAL